MAQTTSLSEVEVEVDKRLMWPPGLGVVVVEEQQRITSLVVPWWWCELVVSMGARRIDFIASPHPSLFSSFVLFQLNYCKYSTTYCFNSLSRVLVHFNSNGPLIVDFVELSP